MSEEKNASVVRDFYAMLLGGEAETALQKYVTPDFVWANPLPEAIPYGGTFRGLEGAGRYLELVFGTLDLSDFEIEEVVAAGDRVVVIGRESALVKASGRRYAQEWVHVLRLRDGRIEELREYNDTAAMLAAFD